MTQTGQISVTMTPTLIFSGTSAGHTLSIYNTSVSKSVFLDGANVTAETGFELAKNTTVVIPMAPYEELWGGDRIGCGGFVPENG